jgi:2-hydroxy-3-keto-5-methylthiopentenyl-1-phosphate phosphatase
MTGKSPYSFWERRIIAYTEALILFYSHFGHDKSLEIKPYKELPADQKPVMFYAGDGVSDLSAAKETDLLFAKKNMGELSY